jgi:hypothetical protein
MLVIDQKVCPLQATGCLVLKQYRLTIWYISSGGELQFMEPVLIEAAGEGEAARMAAVFARLLVTGFAAKVMIRIEGHGFDHSVELGQQQAEYAPSGVV